MAVVVFGSINMDLIVHTPRWPVAGETVTGQAFYTVPGGKGANQAVAAARLGAATQMVGRVGGDAFGAQLRAHLQAEGVAVTRVVPDVAQPSGIALIAVDAAAQNRIIVVPGANGAVGTADLARLETALAGARVLLLQLEIPLDAVLGAARVAAAAGVPVVLDPAPVPDRLPGELLAQATILTPNEPEAAALVGFPLDGEAAIVRAGRALVAHGARNVIITLGERGAYWTDGRAEVFRPGVPVAAVDTVGAGDAFNGALAVALAEDRPLDIAITWGLAAGALAVTRPGAQAALPTRAALLALLAQIRTLPHDEQ
jgi:ribokinase